MRLLVVLSSVYLFAYLPLKHRVRIVPLSPFFPSVFSLSNNGFVQCFCPRFSPQYFPCQTSGLSSAFVPVFPLTIFPCQTSGLSSAFVPVFPLSIFLSNNGFAQCFRHRFFRSVFFLSNIEFGQCFCPPFFPQYFRTLLCSFELSIYILSLDNPVLKQEHAFQFLGADLDENLSWKSHINNICKKISKSIGIIHRIRF